jgi:hypothetical protein
VGVTRHPSAAFLPATSNYRNRGYGLNT